MVRSGFGIPVPSPNFATLNFLHSGPMHVLSNIQKPLVQRLAPRRYQKSAQMSMPTLWIRILVLFYFLEEIAARG